MANDADLAYFAGFFDGEGSVSVTNDVLRVSVGQLDKRPLLMMQGRWGGRLRLVPKGPTYRDIWHWTIESGKAMAVLEELLPHLIVKRDVALVGIDFQMLRHADRSAVTDDERSLRKVLADTLKFLNRKRTYG